MAVVQISKIQIRRGLKNSTSGVPQLSSAEMAWALDTQELFIGNGSVADGAPYVGNTKIITEHDNILDLASAYRFANNDTAIVDSVSRSLQSKLDEYVSLKDFGVVGDGVTDCTAQFQNALDDLFKNSDETYKKILLVPNGEYVISSELRIPSFAKIQGETAEGAVLHIGSSTIRLVSSDGSEFVDFSSTKRAESILVKNLKISRTTGTLDISGIRNSKFEGVIFQGGYELGDSIQNLISETSALFWQNPSSGVAVDNLEFDNCVFTNNSISLKCIQTAAFKTRVKLHKCKFYVNFVGVFIDGVEGQSNDWYFSNCDFEETFEESIRATAGRDMLIESSSFFNCGNGLGTAQYPISPIVYFGEKTNNKIVNCRNNRQQSAGIVDNENVASVIEVENADKAVFIDRVQSPIYLSDSFRPLAVFSATARYITIDYFLQLGATVGAKNSRIGQLTISLGDDLSGVDNITPVSITDSYQYSPNFITTPGGITMTNFEFSAELRDSDNDSGMETVVLFYKNPIARGAIGNISFNVSYGV